MLISGRCHCGNILFALDWRREASEIPARACTCSFCAKHGGVWTSCPTGSLTVSVKDRVCVSKYAFGTKTAEFHVCTACGVVPDVDRCCRRGPLPCSGSVQVFIPEEAGRRGSVEGSR